MVATDSKSDAKHDLLTGDAPPPPSYSAANLALAPDSAGANSHAGPSSPAQPASPPGGIISGLLGVLRDSVGGVRQLANFGKPTEPSAEDGVVQESYPHFKDTPSAWRQDRVNGPRSHRATLELDLGIAHDAALFALTRGNGNGSLVLATATDDNGPNAKATIVVHYDPPASTDHALWQVCTLERPLNKSRGFGVYFPDAAHGGGWWHRFDVTITVSLPKSVHVREFTTNTSNYNHLLDVSDGTTFDTLGLRGSNANFAIKSPITAKTANFRTSNAHIEGTSTITADSINMVTSNARIVGSFTATNYLSLQTSNAAITAHALAIGSSGANNTAPSAPTLKVATSNAGITISSLRLLSLPETTATFAPSIQTSNGPLDIAVTALHPRATLNLAASTSNAPAKLALPASFAGAVVQRSSNGGHPAFTVPAPGAMADPLGRGRAYVAQKVARGRDTGGDREDRVGWGEDEGATGSVRLETSNGRSEVVVLPGWE